MKFGNLIFRKLFKFVANGCEILRLKCTKFDFGQGSAPDPAGSLQRSLDLLAGFKGPTFKGGEEKGCKMGGEMRGIGMEQEGREEEGTPKVGLHPRCPKSRKIP